MSACVYRQSIQNKTQLREEQVSEKKEMLVFTVLFYDVLYEGLMSLCLYTSGPWRLTDLGLWVQQAFGSVMDEARLDLTSTLHPPAHNLSHQGTTSLLTYAAHTFQGLGQYAMYSGEEWIGEEMDGYVLQLYLRECV